MASSSNRPTRTKQSNDELPVRKVGDIDRIRSYCIYGRSGTGKTTFAATYPKPILYIDVRDEGTDSIKDVDQIDVYEVKSFEDFEVAYWWLQKNSKKYKTVIIDTVSQLQQLVVQEQGAKKKVKNGRNAGDWGTLTKGDWGDIAAIMKEWLVNYRDLVNLGIIPVFIAQDRTFNLSDEDDSQDQMLAPEVGPALSPSVAKTLNAAVSVIANTFIREREIKKDGKKTGKVKIEYCLGLAPSSLYTRKVRKPLSNKLPEALVNPEYEDLVDIIEGE